MSEEELPTYKIQNIVIKATLEQAVVIPEIIAKIGHGKYDPSRFSAAILKFDEPKVTMNIFSSGKVILSGAKSINCGLYALFFLKEKLQVNYTDIEIINMLMTMNLQMQIDIESLFELNREHCIYDNKLFPSLVFKPPNSSCGSSIFQSGKITIYGCKNLRDIKETIFKVVTMIDDFKSTPITRALKSQYANNFLSHL